LYGNVRLGISITFVQFLYEDFFFAILTIISIYLFAEGVQPIAWATRMRIAIDVARGLSFLHNLDANVIYRDLKASNILLDSVCCDIFKVFEYEVEYKILLLKSGV